MSVIKGMVPVIIDLLPIPRFPVIGILHGIQFRINIIIVKIQVSVQKGLRNPFILILMLGVFPIPVWRQGHDLCHSCDPDNHYGKNEKIMLSFQATAACPMNSCAGPNQNQEAQKPQPEQNPHYYGSGHLYLLSRSFPWKQNDLFFLIIVGHVPILPGIRIIIQVVKEEQVRRIAVRFQLCYTDGGIL